MNISKLFNSILLSIVAAFLFSSCSENSSTSEPTPKTPEKYIMSIVTDPGTFSGFLAVVDSMPSGTIDVSKLKNPTQIAFARDGGFTFKGAYFQSTNAAGDPGIQKFTVNSSGQLTSAGFISGGDRSFAFGLFSETKGYYFNNILNEKKIQIFNPTTMARTGDIDCSTEINKFVNKKVVSTDIGNYFIARDGKAFVQVFYNDAQNMSVYDSTFLAVVDIATDKIDKIIIHPAFVRFGYFGQPNLNYINVDANNDLYFSSFIGDFGKRISFNVLRIKSGQTTFDPTFRIDTQKDNNGLGFALGGLSYKGKIYTKIFGVPVPPDFSNLNQKEYYAYEIDPITKSATKISGIPAGYWKSIGGPVVFNDKVYFVVENDDADAYYYSYDPVTKVVKKEITVKGGLPAQILKLQ